MNRFSIKSSALVLAVLFLVSSFSLLLTSQTRVYAYDTGNYDTLTTASRLKTSISDLPILSTYTADEQEHIKKVAECLALLPTDEKRKVTSDSIKRLANVYNTAFSVGNSRGTDDLAVDIDSDETRSKRISEEDSLVYGVSAVNLSSSTGLMYVEQHESASTGSSSSRPQLWFTLSGLNGPVYVDFKLQGSPFSSSKDYELEWEGKKLSSVSVGSSYVRFSAPGNGAYKLYLDGDSSDTTFWDDVIDDIDYAESGDKVRVSLGSRTQMPTEVLEVLDGRAVTLILSQSGHDSLSIYGKDIRSIPNSDYVKISTLRSTYGDSSSSSRPSSSSSRASSSSAPSSSSSTAPVVPSSSAPNPFNSLPGGAGTVSGGVSTPNAGGAPPPQDRILATPKPAPLPVAPPSSSSEAASSSESSSSETASEPLTLPTVSEASVSEVPVAEVPSTQASGAVQLSALSPVQPQSIVSSRVELIVSHMGFAQVIIFLVLTIASVALGTGLLVYSISNARRTKHPKNNP